MMCVDDVCMADTAPWKWSRKDGEVQSNCSGVIRLVRVAGNGVGNLDAWG